MLLARYTEVGIARVHREGSTYGWYWATNFGTGDGERLAGAALARLRGDGDRQVLASVLTRGFVRMVAARQLADVR